MFLDIERVVTFPLIISAIGADLFDLSRHVLKQIREGFGIADIVGVGHDADDFERLCFSRSFLAIIQPRLGEL